MLVTVNLPDDLARQIRAKTGNLPRRLLEGYAREAYRSGDLSAPQIQVLLEFQSLAETNAFLRQEGKSVHSNGEIAYPLEGTVLRYDDPFGPAISLEEWEAEQ